PLPDPPFGTDGRRSYPQQYREVIPALSLNRVPHRRNSDQISGRLRSDRTGSPQVCSYRVLPQGSSPRPAESDSFGRSIVGGPRRSASAQLATPDSKSRIMVHSRSFSSRSMTASVSPVGPTALTNTLRDTAAPLFGWTLGRKANGRGIRDKADLRESLA